MKYIILLYDGMSDYPIEELGGKTPMEAAKKPRLDRLAEKSLLGLVKTVSDGMAPGSDVANLSVLGYDPAEHYTGRSPLEAGSIGIDMKDGDVSFRCNLVTLSDEADYRDKTMLDYCADDISTEDAAVLIEHLAKHFQDGELSSFKQFKLYGGVGYRHCLIWDGGTLDLGTLTPPHNITGKKITDYLPAHKNAEELYAIMKKSYELLSRHPINIERVKNGHGAANSAWLWGEGKRAALPGFEKLYGLKGSMISAVDLLKGIGRFAGLNVVNVPGATGYLDSNFKGKAQACLDEFKNGADFVYVHMEAPDECGHRRYTEGKVQSIEIIDNDVLGILLPALEEYDDYKMMVLPDHATPLSLGTHTNDPVPFLLYQKTVNRQGNAIFSEKTAAETGLFIEPGHSLMKYFLTC
ncbi:MAG: cofactor-independent phosphoglycerate mutase [Oscillospiraceae bacterium]|nr:cofactor-independent phosphoglycerate mutase [Oscillospiraceae bacterium]